MYSFIFVPIFVVAAYLFKRYKESSIDFEIEQTNKLDDGYTEIIYRLNGKKYILVTSDDDIPYMHASYKKPWILAAWTQTQGDSSIDVTEKVLEYAGPEFDFHGYEVDFAKVFDNTDLLYIQDTNFIVHCIDLSTNEQVDRGFGVSLDDYGINICKRTATLPSSTKVHDDFIHLG